MNGEKNDPYDIKQKCKQKNQVDDVQDRFIAELRNKTLLMRS